MTKLETWVKPAFAEHRMTEAPVRSFRFARVRNNMKGHVAFEKVPSADDESRYVGKWVEKGSFYEDSAYHYVLTWTPGHLTIAGDIGEMTLTHYSSLAKFESGIAWATSSDEDYLLGKSNKQQIYQSDDTAREICRMLNEDVIETLLGHQHWSVEEQKTIRKGGLIQELRDWRRELAAARVAGVPEDELPERPYDAVALFETHGEGRGGEPRLFECWQAWQRAWKATEDDHYRFGSELRKVTCIFKARGRRAIRELLSEMVDDERSAGDLCSDLEVSDYYGSYNWSHGDLMKIHAIREGCKQILASLTTP